MILDPYREGCTIWMGENVTSIKGSPQEVCEQIYMRVVVARESASGNIHYEQVYEIGVDIGGIGITYKNILNDMGIKTYDIRGKRPDDILPLKTSCIPYNSKPEIRYERIARFRF